MKMLSNKYDFYDLPEKSRIEMVGTCFRVEGRASGDLFFAVGLNDKQFNYGVKQGLILVSAVRKTNVDHKKWFRICAISPDDLDLDLDFNEAEIHHRQNIISYMQLMKLTDTTYKAILSEIQCVYQAGVFTSG